jgi:hypothetical protein
MYCIGCGKGEQIPDSYCRSCGVFLTDPTKGSSLISRLFGITDPERHVKFTLTVDLVTAIVSALLIFFLMGYFDATYDRTGTPTPPIVYLVYVFLGAVSVWQLLSFTVLTAYKKKLAANKQRPAPDKEVSEVSAGNTQKALPSAESFGGTSVTERTTRTLEPVRRKQSD